MCNEWHMEFYRACLGSEFCIVRTNCVRLSRCPSLCQITVSWCNSTTNHITTLEGFWVSAVDHLLVSVWQSKQSSRFAIHAKPRCSTRLQALDESDLDINKLCALATDGASVMTGVHKGVAARLKNDVSHLISTHCT